MAKSKQLPCSPTASERVFGLAYAAFDLFALPSLLGRFNALLVQPLNSAWINFIYFSLNFLLLIVILHRYLGRSLGYTGKHAGDLLISVLLGALGYWVCNYVICDLIARFLPDFSNPNDSAISATLPGGFAVMAVGTVLLVPVAEELIHRALIFGSLHRRSRAAAYTISAVFFAALHVTGYLGSAEPLHLLVAFAQYLPPALLLAWAYEKSGSIFAPMLIHAAINAMGIWALR